ncbi:hypothetical protein EYF80_040614 [Liparis tanakae]|uniref:Uncharacterized protein n=1 Tax=Liparis tanakae TaxID=230148 RepID=A0A4Z2G819_9TELE|nr:hypothetical protein EYF80_040614 [Liparis tanakae]
MDGAASSYTYSGGFDYTHKAVSEQAEPTQAEPAGRNCRGTRLAGRVTLISVLSPASRVAPWGGGTRGAREITEKMRWGSEPRGAVLVHGREEEMMSDADLHPPASGGRCRSQRPPFLQPSLTPRSVC